ncbi:MAG: alanine racemase [Rikenellaceae bacterium]
MKYHLTEIAKITHGLHLGVDHLVDQVSTDSRNNIPHHSLFVAINGCVHDAHYYLDELLGRGVVAFLVERDNPYSQCLVERIERSKSNNLGLVVVEDSLAALQLLAQHHRQQFSGTVVAITGSNGKTIVKEWIASLWESENGKLMRSPRSYNSQLGVALSLLRIEGDETIAIIEAGISKVGEMQRLHQMIQPDIVLFTNLGKAHQENFATTEQHLHEKELLFVGAKHIIKAQSGGTIQEQNLSCVMALYALLGVSHKEPSSLQPLSMRLEVQQGVLGSLVINDSYNSDIDSLRIALEFARHEAIERPLMVVLSDILESSLDDHRLYAQVAQMIGEYNVDLFVGVGEKLQRHHALFDPSSLFYSSCEEFLDRFAVQDIASKAVLIKGSRPYGFERISRMFESRVHTTVMEVNLTSMRENLNRYRSQLKAHVKTMAMVKAWGYGTGSVGVARMLQQQGVDYLAVAFADEGVELRRGGIHLPIVVLNADNGSFATMIEYQLEPEIYSLGSLQQYLDEARAQGVCDLPIHIKIDSGMHRLGFTRSLIAPLCEKLRGQRELYVSTIFSHLSSADMPQFDDFTGDQISFFDRLSSEIVDSVGENGGHSILRHICNTSGIERFPRAHFDMVRVGIGLYSGEIAGNSTVCRLYTRIVQIKSIPSGDSVGYCRSARAEGDRRIAIIPIGYADGISRALGCGAIGFLVNGSFAPTIGNICMDTTILDITGIEGVSEGDQVEIFGGGGSLTAMARACGTIDYEILTGVSSRIKRLYIND